jgi:hypothetical protein
MGLGSQHQWNFVKKGGNNMVEVFKTAYIRGENIEKTGERVDFI